MPFLGSMRLMKGVESLLTRAHGNNFCRHAWNQRSLFHIKPCLMEESKFVEKPAWLKKRKAVQAFYQKDDGVPVFLKAGTRDKILYNITLLSVGIMFVKSMLFLVELSKTK